MPDCHSHFLHINGLLVNSYVLTCVSHHWALIININVIYCSLHYFGWRFIILRALTLHHLFYNLR